MRGGTQGGFSICFLMLLRFLSFAHFHEIKCPKIIMFWKIAKINAYEIFALKLLRIRYNKSQFPVKTKKANSIGISIIIIFNSDINDWDHGRRYSSCWQWLKLRWLLNLPVFCCCFFLHIMILDHQFSYLSSSSSLPPPSFTYHYLLSIKHDFLPWSLSGCTVEISSGKWEISGLSPVQTQLRQIFSIWVYTWRNNKH